MKNIHQMESQISTNHMTPSIRPWIGFTTIDLHMDRSVAAWGSGARILNEKENIQISCVGKNILYLDFVVGYDTSIYQNSLNYLIKTSAFYLMQISQ